MECANHACKCYRGAFEKLVNDNPSYKGSGRLTKKMRQKLVSAARCAIRMRSKESYRLEAVAKLNKDLLNGPYHCFGIHTHCSTNFCSVAQSRKQPASSSSLSDDQHPTSSSSLSDDQHATSSSSLSDDQHPASSSGVRDDQQPASSLSVWAESTSLEEMDNQTDSEFVYEI